MSRKANLVPTSLNKFDPTKHLTRGNIVLVDSGLWINIVWSKTNQYGDRILQVPVPRIHGSPLCPIRAYERLISIVPAHSSDPAFTYALKPKLRTVTQYLFVKVLREHLHKAEYNASSFTGHSFRRGGATFAFVAGVPGELIQIHRDWASAAYLRYLDITLQSRWKVALKMRNHLISLL